jgi:ATP-dependent DNA helicase RecQ
MVEDHNWVEISVSNFEHEKEGLEYIRKTFPAKKGFKFWSNFMFADLKEVDLLVAGPTSIVMIELKGSRDMQTPKKLTIKRNGQWVMKKEGQKYPSEISWSDPNQQNKSKIYTLKKYLDKFYKSKGIDTPYIYSLAFLHHKNADLSEIKNEKQYAICGRAKGQNQPPLICDAILDLSLVYEGMRDRPAVDVNLFEQALKKQGIASKGRNFIRSAGTFELKKIIATRQDSQDWYAKHKVSEHTSRVRCYPLSNKQTKDELRKINKHVTREFELLKKIKHPSIEWANDCDLDGKRGPYINFEDDFKKITLAEYVIKNIPPYHETRSILRQIAECLKHVHGKSWIHRTLNPNTIYIHPEDKKIEIRNWVNSSSSIQTTKHEYDPSMEMPEFTSPILQRGREIVKPSVDIFSLGCIAYFMGTGNLPPFVDGSVQVNTHGLAAEDIEEIENETLQLLIMRSTELEKTQGIKTAIEFLDDLNQNIDNDIPVTQGNEETPEEEKKTDTTIDIELQRRLGKGGSGTAYECIHEDQLRVVKIANDRKADETIEGEAIVLDELDHQGIVRLHGEGKYKDRSAIVIDSAGEKLLGELLRTKKITKPHKRAIIENLIDVGCYLEEQQVVHGDLHPDHIGIAAYPNDLQIKLFDFSLFSSNGVGTPGSIAYSDPFSQGNKQGQVNDIYSLASIIYSVWTQEIPLWGDGTQDPYTDKDINLNLINLAQEEEDFFRTCLGRDVKNRPQTIIELKSKWKKLQNIFVSKTSVRPPSTAKESGTKNTSIELTNFYKYRLEVPYPERDKVKDKCAKAKWSEPDSKGKKHFEYWYITDKVLNSNKNFWEKFKPRLIETELLKILKEVQVQKNESSEFNTNLIDLKIEDSSNNSNYIYKPMCFASESRDALKKHIIEDLPYQQLAILKPKNVEYIKHEDKFHNVLSIAEKIIKRGRTAPLSPFLENSIDLLTKNATENNAESIAPNILDTLIFDSESEKTFVKKALLQSMHPNQFSCITTQVNLAALTQNNLDYQRNERVDIVVCDNNQVKLVIEIDGDQHSKQVDYDKTRDDRLKSAGWTVVRIATSEISDSNNEKIEEVVRLAKSCSPTRPPTIKQDILTRCKHAQVTLLEILKSSSSKEDHIHIEWPKWDGIDTEKLSRNLLKDFNNLINEISVLYGANPCHLKLTAKANKGIIFCECEDAFDEKWIIRDLHIPGRYKTRRSIPRNNTPLIIEENNCKKLLERIFGFESFRLKQFDALKQGLLGNDAIVLLPTGAGKTMIFQLCAMLRPGPGLIIDPLIALINDQLMNLLHHGITCAAGITSATNNRVKELNLHLLETGELLFMYIAPERFQKDDFRLSIRQLTKTIPISVAAIDETHCVSEWGHNFRPSYLNIAQLIRKCCVYKGKSPPILALTGTASKNVLLDVKRELDIRTEPIFPESFDRKELQLHWRNVEDIENRNSELKSILAELSNNEPDYFTTRGSITNSGLVFVPDKGGKQGSVLQSCYLRSNCNISNAAFYGGGDPPKMWAGTGKDWDITKEDHARRFKSNEITALATTSAFGMGIDKPNIRWTINYFMEPSIESLYQQAGRAGRDRKRSDCYFMVCFEDKRNQNDKLLNPKTTLEEINRMLPETLKPWFMNDVEFCMNRHIRSYKGIEKEMSHVRTVCKRIQPITVNKTVKIKWSLTQNDKSNNLKNDTESYQKELEYAIHRLQTIGVISDYTKDWKTKEFTVEVHGVKSNSEIIKKLKNYIKNFDHISTEKAARKLAIDIEKSNEEFANIAAEVLTTFIYEHVEKSKRRATKTVYDICNIGINDTEKAREELLSYLAYTKFEEPINALYLTDQREKTVIEKVIQAIDITDEIKTIDETVDARLACQKALVSQPESPFLLYLLALCASLCEIPSTSTIEQNASLAYSLLFDNVSIEESDAILQQSFDRIDKFKAEDNSTDIQLRLGYACMQGITETKDEETTKDYARHLSKSKDQRLAKLGQYYLTRSINNDIESILEKEKLNAR